MPPDPLVARLVVVGAVSDPKAVRLRHSSVVRVASAAAKMCAFDDTSMKLT